MNIFNKAQKDVANQAGKTEKSVHSLDDVFRALSPSTLTAVAGITALVGSVKALTSAFSGAINNYAHFESMQKGLETFFQDADKGKAKFEELRKLSNQTTYGVDELANSFTQLANVGVNTDTISKKLLMLGNVAQGDKNKFAELVQIYAKVNSTGKAGAMQLQQIASRGIPIYDMLKKMGVQGTATAEDITKAFEQMTQEGGQFYNAMNNINDTIEGKRGFISDYLKEMSVNFAEVTGLADAYKKALDVLLEAISKVSDKLLEWNDNPVMKAIVQGTFVGLLSAIGMTIAVNIIPKLTEVIGLLIKVNLLSGAKGWAVLAVAGVATATTALISYKKNLKDAQAETKKLAEETEKLANGWNSGKRNDKLDYAKNMLAQMEGGKRYNELLAQRTQLEKEIKYNGDLGYGINTAQDELNLVNKQIKAIEKIISDQKQLIANIENEIDVYNKLNNLKTDFNNIYKNSLSSDEQSKINIKEQLNTVLEYKKNLEKLNGQKDNEGSIIRFDDNTRRQIDDTIRYLENKLKGVNAWEDVFESVTGVKVGTGTGRAQKAGSDYENKMKALYDLQIKARKAVGEDTGDVAQDFVDEIKKQIKELLTTTNIDESFTETDTTIQSMIKTMDFFQKMIETVTTKDLTDFEKALQNIYGFSEEKAQGLAGKSGTEWFAQYVADLTKNTNAKQQLYEKAGINQGKKGSDYALEQASTLLSTFESLISQYNFSGAELDSITSSLAIQLKILKGQFVASGGDIEDWNNALNNSTENIKNNKSLAQWAQEQKDSGTAGGVLAGGAVQGVLGLSGDLSKFTEAFAKYGDPLVAFLDLLVQDLFEVIGGLDGVDKAFNPILYMVKQLTPTLQAIVNLLGKFSGSFELIGMLANTIIETTKPIFEIVITVLTEVIELVFDILNVVEPFIPILQMVFTLVKAILFPIHAFIKALSVLINVLQSIPFIKDIINGLNKSAESFNNYVNNMYKDYDDSVEELIERNKDYANLYNDQKKTIKDLTNEYKSLLSAMQENEEWYLKKKTELNANTRKESYQKVNDMILTPQGRFSTHPNDYIIATKNPASLGSNRSVFNMNVNNTVSDDVQVQTHSRENATGGQDIFLTISRKIASDVADGANGWDSALTQRDVRMSGRMLAL